MLTILFNQYTPHRVGSPLGDERDPTYEDTIKREDEELCLLVPCFMKVILDARFS